MMNSFNLILSGKHFICPSILNDSFVKKWKKQMKDTQNEIKQNIQGTNSDKKETRIQKATIWNKRKK